MRHDKLVPGAILIALGVIFLLRSFGYIHIHWLNILHLWPIFLVIGGINLLFAHNRSLWATVLKLAVVFAGIFILLFANFNNRFNFWPNYSYHFNNDDDDDNDSADGSNIVKIEGNSVFTEPFHADAKAAVLNISGGGTVYTLSDTTNELFQANTREFGDRYEYTHHSDDSVFVLNFRMKNNTHFNWHKNKSNTAAFKLNTAPVWDINVEAGATKLDFDLTKFKIRKLDIDGGAASFKVKLGEPLAATRLNVETGASEVTISIPENAACSIETDTGLSSKKFDGFSKTDDNKYETAGFAQADKKIYIHMSGGISDFKVNRY